jgi:AP-4 complex subunit epsilon-1
MTYEKNFRKDLVNKICSLSERFAPSQEWFLKTMNIVFEFGSEFVDNLLLNNYLKLLNENYAQEGPELGLLIIE